MKEYSFILLLDSYYICSSQALYLFKYCNFCRFRLAKMIYSKHPHMRTYDFGFQADQVLIYPVLSEKSV